MILTSLINSLSGCGHNDFSKNYKKNDAAQNQCDSSVKVKIPNNPNFYASVFGVKTNSLERANNDIELLFNTLKRISDKSSDFCKMDIKKSNFMFNLRTPEKDMVLPDSKTVTKQAAADITSILRAIPELYSIMGKKQHSSHDFTLDVHTFSVLQEVIKNPMFENLSDSDKRILMFSSILHDIEKAEGIADSEHPYKSAKTALNIAERFGFSNGDKEKIYKLIKNHSLLEKCNKAYPKENQDSLILFYANELKDGSMLEMEQILTKADLLCTKENDKSYYKYKGAYESIFAKLFAKRNLLY